MIYYTSDLHLNHKNIIRLCNRPFQSVEEMNDTLVRNWNNKVKPTDEVYFLGDFCWGKDTANDRYEIVKYLNRLNGRKYFITGNHDYNFGKRQSVDGYCEWVRNYAEIRDNGRNVVLFHYPIEDWDGKYRGSYHLFGHIHNNTPELNTKIPNRFNVCVDVNDFEPKTLDELIERNRNK